LHAPIRLQHLEQAKETAVDALGFPIVESVQDTLAATPRRSLGSGALSTSPARCSRSTSFVIAPVVQTMRSASREGARRRSGALWRRRRTEYSVKVRSWWPRHSRWSASRKSPVRASVVKRPTGLSSRLLSSSVEARVDWVASSMEGTDMDPPESALAY
jgi:hypothetical protein